MAFAFNWDKAPESTKVFVKVEGVTQTYRVGTDDFSDARQEVIKSLGDGFRRHGAVLALIK